MGHIICFTEGSLLLEGLRQYSLEQRPRWNLFVLFCLAVWFVGILVPSPGIEPRAPAMEVQSPNHWSTGNSQVSSFSCVCHLPLSLYISISSGRTKRSSGLGATPACHHSGEFWSCRLDHIIYYPYHFKKTLGYCFFKELRKIIYLTVLGLSWIMGHL